MAMEISDRHNTVTLFVIQILFFLISFSAINVDIE